MPIKEFLLKQCDARLWKYLVLWSPLLNHNIRDRCFHILVSRSSKVLISSFKALNRVLFPLLFAISSSLISNSFFQLSSLWTLPKTLWFHYVKSFPHCFTLLITTLSESVLAHQFQAASIISPHRLSESHISSKRNNFFWGASSIPVGLISSGQ